jgi:hypothetical protein
MPVTVTRRGGVLVGGVEGERCRSKCQVPSRSTFAFRDCDASKMALWRSEIILKELETLLSTLYVSLVPVTAQFPKLEVRDHIACVEGSETL